MAGYKAHHSHMTTETMSSTDTVTGNAGDPGPLFATPVAIAEAGHRRCAIRPARLAVPMLRVRRQGPARHLVFVLNRVAALGRGDEAFAPSRWPTELRARGLGCRLAGRGRTRRGRMVDDAKLTQKVVLPGRRCRRRNVAMYVSEITTHTWDVAKRPVNTRVEDAVCQLALDAMHRDLPMADRTPMWEESRPTRRQTSSSTHRSPTPSPLAATPR